MSYAAENIRGDPIRQVRTRKLDERFVWSGQATAVANALFWGRSTSYLCVGANREFPEDERTDAYSFCIDALKTVRWLPHDHPVVDELLNQAEAMLRSVPRLPMSELECYTIGLGEDWLDGPLGASIALGSAFSPEQLFKPHYTAAGCIIKELAGREGLAVREILHETAVSLGGYTHRHTQSVYEFANRLPEQLALQRFKLHADCGREEVVDSLIEHCRGAWDGKTPLHEFPGDVRLDLWIMSILSSLRESPSGTTIETLRARCESIPEDGLRKEFLDALTFL